MTLMTWGERPEGTWTLQLETMDSTTGIGLSVYGIVLYSTCLIYSFLYQDKFSFCKY